MIQTVVNRRFSINNVLVAIKRKILKTKFIWTHETEFILKFLSNSTLSFELKSRSKINHSSNLFAKLKFKKILKKFVHWEIDSENYFVVIQKKSVLLHWKISIFVLLTLRRPYGISGNLKMRPIALPIDNPPFKENFVLHDFEKKKHFFLLFLKCYFFSGSVFNRPLENYF